MMFTLNENIKRYRVARGWNQVEFAKFIGVTKQCVSNWENDNVVPSIEMLVKMAELFKVSTDELLGRTDKNVIDVSLLTEEQIGHVALLVRDLSELNSKTSKNR